MTASRLLAALLLSATAGCAASAAPPASSALPSTGGTWRTAAAQAMSRVHAPAVRDATCRQVLRTTVGGGRLRLRLSDAGVDAPLRLSAVTVAVRTAGAAVDPATLRPVTVGGRRDVVVPAGGQVTTDPVALPVRARDDVAVSVAVAGTARLPEHLVGAASGWCSPDGAGDLTSSPGPGLVPAGRSGLVVDALEVEAAPDAPRGVVAVGDSLTDPPLPPDRHVRWSDRLAERLGPRTAVANAAIGGNRVELAGGYGPTLLERFDRDVLSRPGVGTVVLLAGTNDVSAGIPADRLVRRLEQLSGRARSAGLRVVLGTVPPAHRRPPALEPVRQAVNARLRATTAADAVLDADALLRDPARPGRLRAAYDSGDGLHLSTAGQRALGDAVADLLRRR